MTAILLIVVLAFGLTACGGAKNNKENASGQTSESGTSLSAEPGDDKEAERYLLACFCKRIVQDLS